MPLLYFNFENGNIHPDNDGVDVLDMQAARDEAVRTLGDALRDGEVGHLWDEKLCRLFVTDQPNGKGKVHLALHLTATGGK